MKLLATLLFLCFAATLTGSWDHAGPQSAAVCNFVTGTFIGVGGPGTCIASPTACDGVTDNTAAFQAFVSWVASWDSTHTGQVQLYIPPGRTCSLADTGDGLLEAAGANANIFIVGYGVTLIGGYFHLGTHGWYFDQQHSVRTAAINVGDRSITINPSAPTQQSTGCQTIGAGTAIANCAALFTVGQWLAVAGIDLQNGSGFPPNQAFAQYAKITSVNTVTGVIGLDRPLRDAYETTWPTNPGKSTYDEGGPATVFATSPGFSSTFEWRGFTFIPTSGGEIDTDGSNVTLTDVSCPSGGTCFVPSMTYNLMWNNVQTTVANMEMDKEVENFTINKSSGGEMTFQGAGSFQNLTINNSTYVSIVGNPKNLTMNNVNLTNFYPGPQYFGGTKSLTITNSNIGTVGNSETQPFYGCSAEGLNNATGWSMSAGVITIPNAYMIAACITVTGWAFPGANVCWVDSSNSCAILFQITDLTQDATNTYVHTNAPSCEMACWTFTGGKLGIQVHTAPKATFANNAGDDQLVGWNSAPAGAPIYSYSKTIKNSVNSAIPEYIPLWGNLKKLTATISAGNNYTGVLTSNNTLGSLFGTFVTTAPAFASYTPAVIDVKSAGVRTLDVSGGAPASWACSPASCATLIAAGDTLNNIAQTLWSPGTWTNTGNDTTSDPSHPWTMTVEVITTQNVVP